MRRFAVVSFAFASLLAALAAAPGAAGAKPLHHAHPVTRTHVTHYTASSTGAPLTVRGRSFLDPGNVVPVGSQSNYVNDSTIFNRTTDQTFARSKFGNETLPGPFDLPGRQEPLVDFSTGGYGGYGD